MAARQSGSALVISSTRTKSLSRIGIWPSRAGSRVRALTTFPWVSDTTTSADSPLSRLTRNARSLLSLVAPASTSSLVAPSRPYWANLTGPASSPAAIRMSRPARYSCALAGSSGCGLLIGDDRADPVAYPGIASDQPDRVQDGHHDDAQGSEREPVVRLGRRRLAQVVDRDGDGGHAEHRQDDVLDHVELGRPVLAVEERQGQVGQGVNHQEQQRGPPAG